MKYSIEITINKPLSEVVKAFNNPEDMKKWIRGLESFETFDEEYGKPGSKSLLVFEMGKRKLKMTETILVNDLPKEYTVSYKAKNIFNIVGNRFEELGPDKTRFISQQEFKFSGLMKLAPFVMKPAFKKQTQKFIKDFKDYVENK